MTGTISKVMGKESCCFIKATDQTVYFAHRGDFLDPEIMKLDQSVKFRLKLASIPGKPHPVTDVIAA